VPGVSRHATRVVFGFNLTSKMLFQIRRYGRDIDIFVNLQNGKAGKASKQENSETILAVKDS
jgi:hypothetical protein